MDGFPQGWNIYQTSCSPGGKRPTPRLAGVHAAIARRFYVLHRKPDSQLKPLEEKTRYRGASFNQSSVLLRLLSASGGVLNAGTPSVFVWTLKRSARQELLGVFALRMSIEEPGRTASVSVGPSSLASLTPRVSSPQKVVASQVAIMNEIERVIQLMRVSVSIGGIAPALRRPAFGADGAEA